MTTGPLFDWLDTRGTGVLLHPTSLPGNQGIGTLDDHAVRFLDFLQAAGVSYWQVCPLGPTGYGDSPYQCFSAFAGNPYLIDLDQLVQRGLLTDDEVAPLGRLDPEQVDYGAIYQQKWPLLEKACLRFLKSGAVAIDDREGFAAFIQRQAGWLDDYAYFQALKAKHGGGAWTTWPVESRNYKSALKSPWFAALAPERLAQKFYQYVFFSQWHRIRAAAAKRGIAVIGDIPIFVAADSADVWSHPELFDLDAESGQPIHVAGVPPDYFSADGQLWGNPLYRWEAHAGDNYAWWRARLQGCFELCDVLRIDHFRGFDQYWRIPFLAKTARTGEWVNGPGFAFFAAVRAAFPHAQIIAEDLGALTPSVIELREETGLPGMAILQFAFGGKADNLYLPHNLTANSVIYPGTHDNDTTLGWYAAEAEKTRDHVRRYLRVTGKEIGWDFVRTAFESVSRLAVFTLPDILSLGSEGRFNTPGKAAGNWQWRYRAAQLEALFGGTAQYLKDLGELTGRLNPPETD
jgi:4-alpha-glucanotransferase